MTEDLNTEVSSTRDSKVKTIVKELIIDFILILFALFVIKNVVFIAKVPSGSMEPAIHVGDRIIVWQVNKYFQPNKGLNYNDYAVFYTPENVGIEKGKKLVKRVLGLPGDTIEVLNGIVYRNAVALDEDYVLQQDSSSSYDIPKFTIPNGEFFALGDNRANSNDARYWYNEGYGVKTVPLTNVIGEVIGK